jgi:hypothetical protein
VGAAVTGLAEVHGPQHRPPIVEVPDCGHNVTIRQGHKTKAALGTVAVPHQRRGVVPQTDEHIPRLLELALVSQGQAEVVAGLRTLEGEATVSCDLHVLGGVGPPQFGLALPQGNVDQVID